MNPNLFVSTRRTARISQGRLAKQAGLTQTHVSQFEIGNWELRPDQIAALQDALRSELERKAREAQELLALWNK